MAVKKSPGRPRSEAARQAIMTAARALLAEGGPGALTMEAVAARAGVGKPTLYRYWPNRQALAMAALMDAPPAQLSDSRPLTALTALRMQLHNIAERFATQTGRHITTLLASASPESELLKAFRHHFVLERRTEGRMLLLEAIREGSVRSDIPVEETLDLLYGAVFFRLLVGHAPLTPDFLDQALHTLLEGLHPHGKQALPMSGPRTQEPN